MKYHPSSSQYSRVKYLIIVTIPPSLHLAITLKARSCATSLVTDVCLYVRREMGFGHFIQVFAQIVGIEELYELIKRCKAKHVLGLIFRHVDYPAPLACQTL